MATTDFTSPAGEWEASGDDKFFSNTEVYSMAWTNIDLSTQILSCARNGGPIASTRDEHQIIIVEGPSMTPVVRIHSASGQLLGAFPWGHSSILKMGWSSTDELIIVDVVGEVSLYDQRGRKSPHQFSFGEECRKEGLHDCCIYQDGLVAVTKSFALWCIPDLKEPRLQQLAHPKISQPPSCMAVIEPRFTLSGSVEVILAAGGGLLVADADSAQTAVGEAGAVVKLQVAPSGQFVAAFTADGRLLVWLSDFTKKLSEFSTESQSPPAHLAWCGTDSVVMAWPDLLLSVGPYGDWVNFDLDLPVVLSQEVDGVRILSSDKHSFLRRVPPSLVDIFRIGSTAPGASLFDARMLFDQRSAKADEVLRGVADSLPDAVRCCVEAAGAELSVPRQTALLKAACYGRAFCSADSFPRKRILEVCRLLRLLNAVRLPEVGFPLTMAQLEALTPSALLARLTAASHHLLALRAATMLDLSPQQVLTHWACAKISAAASAPDQQLSAAISAKLKDHAGVSFTQIAAHAQSCGRKSLAAALLENETVAAEQVPLLLKLGEEGRALVRAVESGDTDLVFLVLFSMYRSLPLQDFVAAINARPATRHLFLAYCSHTEPELLEQLYMSMGMYEGIAEMRVKESLCKTNNEAKLRDGAGRRVNAVRMADCIRLLERAADLYSQTKEHGFQAKAATEFAKLRKFQADLEEETGNACFVGLSVTATAQQCIRLGNTRAAARVQSEFRISERRFWWLKAKTLAGAKDWEGLYALANDKRPPVGVEAFINICKQHGSPDSVTAKFIAKLPDGNKKAEEYTAIQMYREAAETAARNKDSDMLAKIQSLVVSTSPLGMAISQIKDRIQTVSR